MKKQKKPSPSRRSRASLAGLSSTEPRFVLQAVHGAGQAEARDVFLRVFDLYDRAKSCEEVTFDAALSAADNVAGGLEHIPEPLRTAARRLLRQRQDDVEETYFDGFAKEVQGLNRLLGRNCRR